MASILRQERDLSVLELLANQRADRRMKEQYGSASTDPLETRAGITLLEMGYPIDTIRNSIHILRRQKESGAEINVQEVLDFIWKEEDIEQRRQEEEASRPRHPSNPQPPTLMECLNLGGSSPVTKTASINTTTSSLTTAAMTVTSDTMGAASSTSMSTSASGLTQNSHASGQEQKPDENQGYKTTVGGAGNKRGGSMMRDDIVDLEEEQKRMLMMTMCKICMENPLRIIFLPCGHFVCCETCAAALGKCPICRKQIQQAIKYRQF